MPPSPESSTLEHVARPLAATPLPSRERAVELAAGLVFAAGAATLLAVGGGGQIRVGVLVALVVAFAVTVRAQFDVGGGYVPPTQLVFVSALLLEPPRLAPCIALAGFLLGRAPDVARRALHPSRLALLPGDCLYTLGPAAVLVAAQVTGPHWGDWPLYLAALVAQLGADFAGGTVRGWLALGVPPALHLRTLIFVWAIDAALSPVGLLAAFASASWRFAFLGVLPLASLLVVLSHERTRRLASELAATREREALIAGASHELQTPLAILSGLIESLARNPGTPEERRAASLASMERQAGHLRYLVGQFVDYALVKAGRELLVHARRTEVGPVLESVSSLWAPEVQVVVTGAATEAVVDATRLHRVVMSLVANAVKYGPPQGPVSISARTEDGAVVVEIADQGPGLRDDQLDAIFSEFRELADRPEGLGVGLFLARASLHAQGGAIRLRNAAGGGLVAELRVPAHAG